MVMTSKTRQDISHTKMEITIKKKLLPLSLIAPVTISLIVAYQTSLLPGPVRTLTAQVDNTNFHTVGGRSQMRTVDAYEDFIKILSNY